MVHVVLSLDCGGLERVVVDLVRHGTERGQRVSVICLERPGTLASDVERDGGQVRCAHKPPGIRPGTIFRIERLLRQLRPDVVHTHQMGALFYAGPAARRAGVRTVLHTEHGKSYADEWSVRVLSRLAGRWAQRFCCVSGDIAKDVIARRIAPPYRVRIVPNGIDTRAFYEAYDTGSIRNDLQIPPTAPVVGTVGRLSEIKRQDILIRAFAELRCRIPDAHLVLVGDGPMMDPLRALAISLGLESCIRFAGYQKRPETYLHMMDVFALTSRSEGMPLAVLEAWAAGVPVVASAVGGLPCMIDPGRTGLLFPSGDEAALAAALADLLSDGPKARAIGEAGRRHVRERFDVRTMAAAYARHYEDLLGLVGGTRPLGWP